MKIHPGSARLRGEAGKPIRAVVTITTEPGYPFDITSSKAKLGTAISFQIASENLADGRKKHTVTVKNLKKDPGKYKDTIILNTNSEKKPQIRLAVSGTILKPTIADITPSHIRLWGATDQSTVVTVQITPKDTTPFDIKSAKAKEGKFIDVRLEKGVGGANKSYLVRVENRKKTAGKYRDEIILTTSHKSQKVISSPVTANISLPRIAQISPPRVVLQGPLGSDVRQVIKITPLKDKAFTIKDVTAKNGTDIRLNLEKPSASNQGQYMLTVESLKKEHGRFTDTIYLHTDHPQTPQLEIGVNGFIFAGANQRPGDGNSQGFMELIKKMQEKQGEGSKDPQAAQNEAQNRKKFEEFIKALQKNKSTDQ